MRPPELVIFDCDGVLVDSERISARVLAAALSAQGLQTTEAQARRDYQGLLQVDMIAAAQARLGRPLPAGWLEDCNALRDEAFRRELTAVPGAEDVVRRLQAAGLLTCVASQGKPEKIQLTLGLTGLGALFAADAVFSATAVPRGKPYPDLFLHAAAAMGVDPTHCIVVEDSASGVKAAVSAGMRALGYCADGDARALAAAGAELFGALATLPTLLGLQ